MFCLDLLSSYVIQELFGLLLSDYLVEFCKFAHLLRQFQLELLQLQDFCFDYISASEGEILEFKELLVDVPKLKESEGEAVAGCISE